MNRIKPLLLVFTLLSQSLVFANEYADIGLPVTKVYSMEEHQGANQNWWLVQGDNGYIYNATGVGINEWDGEKWHLYRNPQQSIVRSISKWHDGRIYAGTIDDIGYYQADELGRMAYYSLLENWTDEQRQIGSIWSTAANQHGVAFLSTDAIYFWDGKQLQTIAASANDKYRLFALADSFIFKNDNDALLYKIRTEAKSSDTPLSYDIQPTKFRLPAKAVVRKIITNNNKNIVVFTANHGIFEQQDDRLIQRVSAQEFTTDAHIYNGIQATDGYYYVVSLNHGLFIITETFEVVRQYTEEHNLGTNTLLSVMEDRQNNIWLSGMPNIIKMIPPHRYSQYSTEGKAKLIENMALINNRVVVVGDGLYGFEKPDNSLSPAFFKSLAESRTINWQVIEYKGHLVHAGSGGVFAQKTSTDISRQEPELLVEVNWARALAIDPITDTLFAATYQGLFQLRYEQVNDQWHSQRIAGIDDDLAYMAIEDSGVIWIGTSSQELYRVEHAQNMALKTQITKFSEVDGLGPNNVIPFNTSFGVVFGTNDGLMMYDLKTQPNLQFIEGFPDFFSAENHDVYRIYEDSKNRIWYRIAGLTGYVEQNLDGVWQSNDAIFKPFSEDSYKGFVLTEDNILWFSKVNGQIYRMDIERQKRLPPKGILNIRKVINSGTKQEVYGGLNQPKLPELDQQNNSIRLHYALAENSIANATTYRHRLLGSGLEQWSEWSSENHKDFTQLRGGNYQFQVEARDGWGRVSDVALSFSVLPVWYLSSTAWVVYIFAGILVLAATAWFSQSWRAKKLNLRNQELEHQVTLRTQEVQSKAKQLQQQQTLKDRFFANVSHEFRTPLTLTIAPLETVLTDFPNLEQSAQFSIKTALKNAQKMLTLVGQVLDINRLESGRFPLRVAEYDITDLINQIVIRFTLWAKQHQQVLISKHTEEPLLMYFDQDQLDKCLSNLVTNAIKYSGLQSKITISIVYHSNKKDLIGIEVSDTGKGVSEESEKRLFERFYQGPQSEHVSEPGTGIGLSLVKELMDLHHGKVELINQIGKGCRFVLWLNKGAQHFDQSQLLKTTQKSILEDTTLTPQEPAATPASIPKNGGDITTLLIVDDNSELRHFISLRLSSYYRIIEAVDGQQGMLKARQQLPDLIISDVMMPVMDGFTMAKNLKSEPMTQTIPIILLTAKSSKRETVEGLQTGADDYLTKPFDTSELIARITGLLQNRKRLRQDISTEYLAQKLSVTKNTSFTEKIYIEVMSQIANPEFNIELLSNAMAMSRSSLNRKCQKEFERSANQYIVETRMQHAIKLLKENKYSISEIAYGTGYESLNYFSRSFKNHFGQSPSSFQMVS